MFTSRAEYRLSLRADNADQRLTPAGLNWGIIGSRRAASFAGRMAELDDARRLTRALSLTPNEAMAFGIQVNRDGIRRSAFELLARPEIGVTELLGVWPELGGLSRFASDQIETEAKYSVYLERQESDIASLRRDEAVRLDGDMDYAAISGLSNELRDRLVAVKPATLGQAGRLEGMTPAALALILAATRKRRGRAAA
jgi:tRNA uridine 5-carboxymethylaminomethyl modification enzyme